MADNLTLNVGTGGAVLATDDVTGVHYQIVKVAFGALDSVTLVTPSAGFPVNLVANSFGALAVTQSGTWNITNISGTISLPTGATTLAEQQTQTTALQLIDDTVHAVNAAFNKANAIAGQLDDVAVTAATENNVAPVRITAQRGLHVNLRDNAGAEVTNLATTPVGGVAHDGVDSGNPIKIGAQARQTWQTAVADADRTNVVTDDLGRIINYPIAPRDLVDQNRIVLTTTTETTLLTAVAAIFLDIVSLDISNESATEVRVDIRDNTAGTVRWSIDLAPDGGGIAKTFHVPFKQTTANQNWTAQLSAAVSSVYITAQAVRNN